jgi:hypothetical protein
VSISVFAAIRPGLGYRAHVFFALASHHWYDIGWVDWLAVGAFPLTLAGLYLTWRQAREASDAAKAAREAVQRTQEQIRAKQLMVLIPQLMWIASEIDSAIEVENMPLVRRYLHNWRLQAGNVNGLLLAADSSEVALATAVNNSVSMAAITEGSLLKRPKATRADCMKAREAITAASSGLNIWIGKNSTEASDKGGVL